MIRAPFPGDAAAHARRRQGLRRGRLRRRVCAALNVTPHVAAKVSSSAIDGRTTRHAGYAVSQQQRKRIEEAFGWGKTVGGPKTMLRGTARVRFQFTLNMAAYNLARLPKLLAT